MGEHQGTALPEAARPEVSSPTTMNKAIKYFRDKEWTMGNGQCHDCCGVHEGWHGHLLHFDPKGIGHKPDCKLALALIELGEKPLMMGDFHSDKEFEQYISEEGFLGVRPKTEHGCPRYKAWSDKLQRDFEDILFSTTP
jgi:hypothetical protein